MVSRRRVTARARAPGTWTCALAAEHLAVEAEVPRLLLVVQLLAQAGRDLLVDPAGVDRGVVAAVEAEDQPELRRGRLRPPLPCSGIAACRRRSRPSWQLALWTWPERGGGRGARAGTRRSGSAQSGPSSATMRRRTNGLPIGGALLCSCASSAAYSAGSASGMVAISWATFISGPFSPPSASLQLGGVATRRADGPSSRAPAIRAAWHADGAADLGVAADPRAEAVLALDLAGRRRGVAHARSGMASSSWSISPSSRPRPLAQKPGSDASRPNGASSSLWRSVPPARSSSR